MARRSNRQDNCVFEFDQIEQWGPELKKLFADALPKRLKRVFNDELPDDVEHAREILIAHMSIDRADVYGRLRLWIEGKRVAAYYGQWMTNAEFARAKPRVPESASLSRAPFECFFEEYVPYPKDGIKRRPRIFRIEIPAVEVSVSNRSDVDELPNVLEEVLNAWAYWLADREFSPADEGWYVELIRRTGHT